MRRPFVIERRPSGYRRTPEAILIADEEAQERISEFRAERVIPEEIALRSALTAYAAVVGWPEARCWLAAKAHESWRRETSKTDLKAKADVLLFGGKE